MSFTPTNMPTARTVYTDLRYRDKPGLTGTKLGLVPPNIDFPHLGMSDVIDGYVWAKLSLNDQIVWTAYRRTSDNKTYLTLKANTTIVEVDKPIDTTMTDGSITVTVKRP